MAHGLIRWSVALLTSVVGGAALLIVVIGLLGLLAASPLVIWAHQRGISVSFVMAIETVLAAMPVSFLVGWALGRYLPRDAGLIGLGLGAAPLVWMAVELLWDYRSMDWSPRLLWMFLEIPLYCLLALTFGSWWGRRQRLRVRPARS